MYVAVKGGEAAIDASIAQVASQRRGEPSLAELSVAQIRSQLRRAVARVMAEGALYDPDLAALAIKQAAGDAIEAVFLLRAYRTTLPRLGYAQPLDTSRMTLARRISSAFKDLPGGQILGPTYDYTQRLLDFSLARDDTAERGTQQVPHAAPPGPASGGPTETIAGIASAMAAGRPYVPRVTDLLAAEALIEPACTGTPTHEAFDLTRQPITYPLDRTGRLQNLARGDEGFLLSMAYSTQRGYAHSHPFAGEIRHGWVEIEVNVPELDAVVSIGDIALTECQMINQFAGDATRAPQFTRGYGLAFGHGERKAMAMALVDRALRAGELGEAVTAPAQMQEFVLGHSDSLEASGFVQHLKLPHYVDFQSELELLRRLRAARASAAMSADPGSGPDSIPHEEPEPGAEEAA